MAKYLTVTECANLTGFKGRNITEWIKKGFLKGVRGPGVNPKTTRFYITPTSLLVFAKKFKLSPETIKAIEEQQ